MATKYSKKTVGRRNGNGMSRLLPTFVAFVFGYLVATAVNLNDVSKWINAVVSKNPSPGTPVVASKPADLPKPKFEFYTLLTKDQDTSVQLAKTAAPTTTQTKPISQTPTEPSRDTKQSTPIDLTVTQKLPLHEPLITTASPAKAVPPMGERYMIQVGSFKNLREAEKMKASLTMKGFEVMIATINQQQTSWYRVTIGPFASRNEAQIAQSNFARSEHIVGMIRKMDA